ncbi:MAG: hypothetical protein WC792_04485 [Candidatus Micrarchaeia archaeon]|jgi:hypothetical protein
MAALQVQEVLHYPRLDTVLMVEAAVKKAREYPTRMELWRSLPRKVQYQTFQVILGYLQESNKIFITKTGEIIWIFAETPAARKLLLESTAHAPSKAVARV